MKVTLVLCLLGMVAYTMAAPKYAERGCIYILGKCAHECEEGTHSYNTGCGYMTPEPTCDDPEPKEDNSGMICDFSACYCDYPTVRDRKSMQCVLIEECPK